MKIRIPAARAASFLYLVPGWLALFGGVIALSGVIMVNKNYMKRL